MIDDLAPGVEPAASGTGLFAFVIAASLVGGALGVDDTLRSAVGR